MAGTSAYRELFKIERSTDVKVHDAEAGCRALATPLTSGVRVLAVRYADGRTPSQHSSGARGGGNDTPARGFGAAPRC